MISIIIPIFNTQRFLNKCLKSIFCQSYKDIEIILVNDASPDNSLDIAKKAQETDSRIVIINKDINEGVDKARFSGLSVAKGEYIMFIDSDDWLSSPKILEHMIEKAETTGVDYVEMGMERVMDRHGWIKTKNIEYRKGLIRNPELFETYFIAFFGYNNLCVNMCSKLYRHDTIKKANLAPSGFSMGEDLLFNLNLFPHLNSIFVMDEIGYSYRFGGMTSKYNKHLYPDLKKLYLYKEQLIDKYNYLKARDYIRIELKNVLRSDIIQQIVFKTGTKKQIIDNLKKELNDPIYNQILQVSDKFNGFHKDPFVLALKNKDAESIYEICLDVVKSERKTRILKRIASWVFTHI